MVVGVDVFLGAPAASEGGVEAGSLDGADADAFHEHGRKWIGRGA